MNSKGYAFAGAGLLAAGLFTPIMTAPIVGSVNLFNNGTNWNAIVLLVLAAIGAGVTARGWIRDAIWPGAAAALVILYLFLRIQYQLSSMREQVAKELAGNPFAGIAQSAVGAVQLQWGWIVLAVGAGMMIYAALQARKEEDRPLFHLGEGAARLVATASALLLLAVPGMDAFSKLTADSPAADGPKSAGAITVPLPHAAVTSASGPTPEEAAYIAQNLTVYDLDAKYFDSMLDGRVPGIRFKLKNNGARTLNRVIVRVVFQDKDGRAISEEEYNPVWVTQSSYGEDNTPLRPNYIWQQPADKFYTAKGVPSEWAAGKATATITDIEFGPNA